MHKANNDTPVLYSFRRCPYAIRARLAIKQAQIRTELREVVLKNKPDSMLRVSPKGTVPVLVLPDNHVVDESLDIMHWALSVNDPDNWSLKGQASACAMADELIQQNDNSFKQALDRYKYSDRYPEHPSEYYRRQGEVFVDRLDKILLQSPYLASEHSSIADIAIFPFIRQFAYVDIHWFEQTPYTALKSWLSNLLDSNLFASVMQKYPPWTTEQKVIF